MRYRPHFIQTAIFGLLFFALLLTNLGMAASHHPQEFLDKIKGHQHEGQEIVQHFCINCHAKEPLIPIGAPRIGVLSDWSFRVKQNGRVLFQHTAEGINAMPARGGCFECSDEQLQLAILAILPASLRVDYNRLTSNQNKH